MTIRKKRQRNGNIRQITGLITSRERGTQSRLTRLTGLLINNLRLNNTLLRLLLRLFINPLGGFFNPAPLNGITGNSRNTGSLTVFITRQHTSVFRQGTNTILTPGRLINGTPRPTVLGHHVSKTVLPLMKLTVN